MPILSDKSQLCIASGFTTCLSFKTPPPNCIQHLYTQKKSSDFSFRWNFARRTSTKRLFLFENYTHESRSSWAALKVTTTPHFKFFNFCIFTQFVPRFSTKTPLPHFQTTFWYFHLGSLTLKVSRGWECNNGPRAKYIAAVVCRARCNTGKVASDVFQDTASLWSPTSQSCIYIYIYTWNLFVLHFGASTLQGPNSNQNRGHLGSRYIHLHTVDGRNPAPPGMYKTL